MLELDKIKYEKLKKLLSETCQENELVCTELEENRLLLLEAETSRIMILRRLLMDNGESSDETEEETDFLAMLQPTVGGASATFVMPTQVEVKGKRKKTKNKVKERPPKRQKKILLPSVAVSAPNTVIEDEEIDILQN